jgi:two-component system, response regulator
MSTNLKVTKILLVEDNPDDILIIERALKEANMVNTLSIVRDGQEAIDYLWHQNAYEHSVDNALPGLILLDINLPKLNGLDVLKRIKDDPVYKKIPTIMLTMSKRDEDVLQGYTNGCNSFIQKPVEFEKFVEVVRQIGLYWGLINVDATAAS